MNFKYEVGLYEAHVHIGEEHVEILFGEGYKLTPASDMSNIHYDLEEKVDIVGTKGSMNGVKINASPRNGTLIEVYMYDLILLGLMGDHIKDFKDLQWFKNINAIPNFKLRGPKGEVEISKDNIYLIS